MRYPSHACFGHDRSGVNMLTSLRFGSIRICICSNLNHSFTLFSPFLWFSGEFTSLEGVMVNTAFLFILLFYTYTNTFLIILCLSVHMYDFLLSYSNLNFAIQDLKYEENSVKAVQCLNDMVTNALMHAEDCLKYMAALRDLAIFRFCAIPQVLFFLLNYLVNCYVNCVTLVLMINIIYQHF